LDGDVDPRCTSKKREAISHLYDSLKLLGEEAVEVFQKTWNFFPHNLKIKETHSPNTLQIYLLRTPWYKEDLRKMEIKCIGFRMSSTLLFPV